MANRRNRFLTPVYLFHIVTQALFSLATPIILGVFIAGFFVTRRGCGTWLYAVLILAGVAVGLWSMVTFILRAMRSLDALEQAQKERDNANDSKGKHT